MQSAAITMAVPVDATEVSPLRSTRCVPRPVQPQLPIWVGGGGEKRTLAIVARYADGWNLPFVAPETFEHKRNILSEHCERVGRDLNEIRCAVNLGLAWSEESLHAQFGGLANGVRPGVLMGSQEQVIDRIGHYRAVGVDQINLALRAPFNDDDIAMFATALGLTAS